MGKSSILLSRTKKKGSGLVPGLFVCFCGTGRRLFVRAFPSFVFVEIKNPISCEAGFLISGTNYDLDKWRLFHGS